MANLIKLCKFISLFRWFRIHLIIFIVPSAIAQYQQSIVEEPIHTRVLLHSTAILRCRVQNQHGPVTWAKDRFVLGTERSLPTYPRYSMIGSSAHGEYHLEIKNVHLSDDAEYQCQIAATKDHPPRSSAPVRLTVLVTPSQPRLTPNVEPISAREGHNVTLSCHTDGSKPAAYISWALVRHSNGSGIVRKLYSPHESVIKSRGQLNDVTSTLEYAPQRSDDGAFIACMIEHETLATTMMKTVQLRIQYSPKVNVTLNSTDQLLENNRALLACNIDAYPSDNIRYVWYQNQEILKNQNRPHLLIQSLSIQHHHNAIFRCYADNGVGEGGYGEYTLKMKYKPKINSPLPSELFFNENETVTLRCEADSNPPAKIKWYKESSTQELSKDNNLTLHKLQFADQGNYQCRAYSEDSSFEPASRQFKVYINGPPRVEIRSLVYGRKGAENFKLHCNVKSPPDSDTKILWKRGDEDFIMNDDEHYSMYTYADGIANHRSILTIRKLEPSDFGIYNCTAQNRLGSDSSITHLVQAEEFPTYAILGVAGGCLAILALALALIIVNRKYLCRSKSSQNGDDQADIRIQWDGYVDDNTKSRTHVRIPAPDVYDGGGDNGKQGYNPIPDFDPSPSYAWADSRPAMTNTTFVCETTIPAGNGMNHYGYPLPVNGHSTYLDDPLMTPVTNHSLMAESHLLNGYPSISPDGGSPTNRGAKMAIGVPYPSTLGSQILPVPVTIHQYGHMYSNGIQGPQAQTQLTFVPGYGGVNGNLTRVDLLSGHMNGGMTSGSGGAAYGLINSDGSTMITSYHRPMPPAYIDQSYILPAPLETLHEVRTPDEIDEQHELIQNQISNSDHGNHGNQRPIRSSSSGSEGINRCASQLSTHV